MASGNIGSSVENDVVTIIDDNDFADAVQHSDAPWIILFGAEWSSEAMARKEWLGALPAADESVQVGYAEINRASIPAHYCGITTVPTLVFWRNGRVQDQVVEVFDRALFDKKIGEWRS